MRTGIAGWNANGLYTLEDDRRRRHRIGCLSASAVCRPEWPLLQAQGVLALGIGSTRGFRPRRGRSFLGEAHGQTPMRLLVSCLMPKHWHLVVWPLYQERFKSFPMAESEHYCSIRRFVERNPQRANLVEQAEAWRWSSACHRVRRSPAVPLAAC